jgi:hypothetical protein
MSKIIDEILKVAASNVLVLQNIDNKTAAKRFAICEKCQFFDKENIKCTECGCFMDIKTRSKVHRTKKRPKGEVTHCPNGFWGKGDKVTANYYRKIDGLPVLT